jgi:hypothetical protein
LNDEFTREQTLHSFDQWLVQQERAFHAAVPDPNKRTEEAFSQFLEQRHSNAANTSRQQASLLTRQAPRRTDLDTILEMFMLAPDRW